MKATISPLIEREVTIKLTDRKAEILCALLGGISVIDPSEAADTVHGLFLALDPLFPERSKTFCDFFRGKVVAL